MVLTRGIFKVLMVLSIVTLNPVSFIACAMLYAWADKQIALRPYTSS